MSEETKLEPCPNCKSKGEIYDNGGEGDDVYWHACCSCCDAFDSNMKWRKSKFDAARDWNELAR